MHLLSTARVGLILSVVALASVAVLAAATLRGPLRQPEPVQLRQATAEARELPDGAARRGAMEQVVRSYILENPEIIRDAMIELERRQNAQQAAQQKLAVNTHAAELFRSPRDFVIGNPRGDVTLVEFFDYNCAFCRRAMADMDKLIEKDADLRVVMKEFPILSEGSVEAARLSLAAGKQGKYLEFHRKLLSTNGQVNASRALSVAENLGLDTAQMRQDAQQPEVMEAITAAMRLASALGVNGTPSYVVGDEVIVGAVGYDELTTKIAEIRAKRRKETN